MKLIIDIDDELVETARFAVRLDMGSDYVKSIANGIPLDKIRAEINNIELSGFTDANTMFARTARQVKQMVLEIIDKYKTESECKEAYDKLKEYKELVDKYNVANNRPDISDFVAVTLNQMKSEGANE